MFTGIIEEKGRIQHIKELSEQAVQLTIEAKEILQDVHLGDSISVNGICLTVTGFTAQSFQVDVMPETIKATSLRYLRPGSELNLERAMRADGRFGGHFVTGHIDGIGEIVQKEQKENALYYHIKVPEDATSLLLNKGSVAVDGISLTIFGVERNQFTLSLIPHTVQATILGNKGVGDIVNIEYDMLGKYVQKMVHEQQADQVL